MKARILLAILLLASCENQSASPETDHSEQKGVDAARSDPPELRPDAEERLMAAAESVKQLSANGDISAVVNQIPLEFFQGRESIRAATAAAAKTSPGAEELSRGMVFDPPSAIRPAGDQFVAVLGYTGKIGGRVMTGCQIAISSDGGLTWGLVSGSSGGVDTLRKSAPWLYEAIAEDLNPVSIGGKARVGKGHSRWANRKWDSFVAGLELPEDEGQATLEFAWPDSLALHVTRTFTTLDLGPELAKEFDSVLEYDMVGKRGDSGYHVQFESIHETDGEPLPAADALVTLSMVVEKLRDWPAEFMVTDPAVPPTLVNLKQARSGLRAKYMEIPGIKSAQDAKAAMEQLLTDSVLSMRATEAWGSLVQAWHGAEFDLNRRLHLGPERSDPETPLKSDWYFSVHRSPLSVSEGERTPLYRLHTLRQFEPMVDKASKTSSVVEMRTWADATPDLVPVRLVRILTMKIGTEEGTARKGFRWEYKFTLKEE